MIFESFNQELTPEILRKTGSALAIAIVISLAALFLGKVIYLKWPKKKRVILQYATLVNNSGFMGLPLVESMYGADGLLFASIFIIPNRVLMWTAGMSLFTRSDSRQRVRRILLNPGMIAVYLGLARRLARIPVPAFLDTSLTKIGAITSPLSMILIGAMLVGVEWKKLIEPAILFLAGVRLLLLPLAALFCLKMLHIDPLVAGVSLVLTGMPAGTTTALLAEKYGADADFGSRCVIATTVLCLFTAPMLMLFV
jgi:predicted permease